MATLECLGFRERDKLRGEGRAGYQGPSKETGSLEGIVDRKWGYRLGIHGSLSFFPEIS